MKMRASRGSGLAGDSHEVATKGSAAPQFNFSSEYPWGTTELCLWDAGNPFEYIRLTVTGPFPLCPLRTQLPGPC